MTIWIAQPTDPDYYGSITTSEQAEIVAANCLRLALRYAAEHWPHARIGGKLVSETQSHSNRSEVDDVTVPDRYQNEIVATIKEYVGRHWTNEALWDPAFDTEAYFQENPR